MGSVTPCVRSCRPFLSPSCVDSIWIWLHWPRCTAREWRRPMQLNKTKWRQWFEFLAGILRKTRTSGGINGSHGGRFRSHQLTRQPTGSLRKDWHFGGNVSMSATCNLHRSILFLLKWAAGAAVAANFGRQSESLFQWQAHLMWSFSYL